MGREIKDMEVFTNLRPAPWNYKTGYLVRANLKLYVYYKLLRKYIIKKCSIS